MQNMTEESAVDVRPIKAGLRDLAARMPKQPEHVHELGKLLAVYMNDEIYPESIRLTEMLMMNDVARGKSGYQSVQIPAKLSGMPPVVVAALGLTIPAMLRAAAGQEHAATAELLVAALKSA